MYLSPFPLPEFRGPSITLELMATMNKGRSKNNPWLDVFQHRESAASETGNRGGALSMDWLFENAEIYGSRINVTTPEALTAPLRIRQFSSHEMAFEYISRLLKTFRSELGTFINLKLQFEILVLKGEVSAADIVLDNIERIYGISIWLYEAKLLLLAIAQKPRETYLITRNKFVVENSMALVHAIFEQLERRIEPTLSVNSYQASLDQLLFSPSPNRTLDLVRFVIDFERFKNVDSLPYIMQIITIFPVIDIFICFVKASVTTHQHWGSFHPTTFEALKKIIQVTNSSISYPTLDALANSNSSDNDILDKHFRGLFTSSCNESAAGVADFIQRFPNVFHAYPIALEAKFIRSAFPSHCTDGNDQPLSHRILESCNTLESQASIEARERASKLALQCSSLALSIPMFAYVETFEGECRRDRAALQYSKLGPVPLGMTPPIRDRLAPDLENALDAQGQNNNYLVGLLKAHRFEVKNKMENAEDVYAHLCDRAEQTNNLILLRRASLGHIRCLATQGKWELAIRMTAKAYCIHQISVEASILDNIIANYRKSLKVAPRPFTAIPIEWPICCHIRYGLTDTYPLYVSYDQFLESNRVTLPRLIPTENYNSAYLIYFFRYICIAPIMERAPVFSKSSAVDEERIAVCQMLLSFPIDDLAREREEIKQLTRDQAIKESVKKIHASKIFVETKGLRQKLGRSLDERYREFAETTTIQSEELRQSINMEELSSNEMIDPSTLVISFLDRPFALFQSLFLDVVHAFCLDTSYGLDSYLSTRIRHGTLAGQLRRQFESESLITRRTEKEGPYAHNDYWSNVVSQMGFNEDDSAIDAVFTHFSESVDNLIAEVSGQWLQIRTNSNGREKGMFDYRFSPDQLEFLYVLFQTESVSHNKYIGSDGFYDFVIEQLWARTEQCLSTTRQHIETDLSGKFSSSLDRLEWDVIHQIQTDEMRSRVTTAITRCKTNISHELKVMSNWFKTYGQVEINDYRLPHAVDTGREIVQKLLPTGFLSLTHSIDIDDIFDGRTFVPMVDIFIIILENIVKHGMREPSAVSAKKLSNGRIKIEAVSRLSIDCEVAQLRLRMKRILDGIDEPGGAVLVAREGGTGFAKIKRILDVDLKQNNAVVSVEVTEDSRFIVILELDLEGLTRE
jgi:hypothetical protein